MLEDIVKKYNCDFTEKRIQSADIPKYENELSISFGPQLREYLLDYGYLGCGYIVLLGINSYRESNSDMIKETMYLREQYEGLDEYIVIESFGEHNYFLIDSNDMIYNVNEDTMDFIDLEIDLCTYLDKHFSELN